VLAGITIGAFAERKMSLAHVIDSKGEEPKCDNG